MKKILYISIILFTISCKPSVTHVLPTILQADSIYIESNVQSYGDYYQSGHRVYSIDLLSDGLNFDSTGYIVGSGYNLYLSDIFVEKNSTTSLPAGTYTMDSTAKDMTFLHGMYFDNNVTGAYLLEIKENQIQRITLFTGGTMTIDYVDGDTLFEFDLYIADSTNYHATYHGYANQ